MEPLLTVEEVADLLKVSRAWVYENKHRIGFARIGGVRFEPEAVREFIERQRVQAAAPRQPRPTNVRPAHVRIRDPAFDAQAAEIAKRLRNGVPGKRLK